LGVSAATYDTMEDARWHLLGARSHTKVVVHGQNDSAVCHIRICTSNQRTSHMVFEALSCNNTPPLETVIDVAPDGHRLMAGAWLQRLDGGLATKKRLVVEVHRIGSICHND
jgi:hypothetical protein